MKSRCSGHRLVPRIHRLMCEGLSSTKAPSDGDGERVPLLKVATQARAFARACPLKPREAGADAARDHRATLALINVVNGFNPAALRIEGVLRSAPSFRHAFLRDYLGSLACRSSESAMVRSCWARRSRSERKTPARRSDRASSEPKQTSKAGGSIANGAPRAAGPMPVDAPRRCLGIHRIGRCSSAKRKDPLRPAQRSETVSSVPNSPGTRTFAGRHVGDARGVHAKTPVPCPATSG